MDYQIACSIFWQIVNITLWATIHTYGTFRERSCLPAKLKESVGKQQESGEGWVCKLWVPQTWLSLLLSKLTKGRCECFIRSKLKIHTDWQMVIYLACLSNFYHFLLIRASKVFVISSDCLLTSIQQSHDSPHLGPCQEMRYQKKKTTTTKNQLMKDYLRYLNTWYFILFDIHLSSVEQETNVQGQDETSDINLKEFRPIWIYVCLNRGFELDPSSSVTEIWMVLRQMKGANKLLDLRVDGEEDSYIWSRAAAAFAKQATAREVLRTLPGSMTLPHTCSKSSHLPSAQPCV